jgi:Ca2+-binding EF-hand superfamily protein
MTNTKKIIIVGLSVIALQLVSTIASSSTKEALMSALDKDLDGLISLKEAARHAKLLEKFNDIDINEDGYISMDELLASDIEDA